ncbi:NAD(P)H-dependent oxidoreductase [Hathewaya histolytica]|uniref:Putative NADPH-quinone reductase n=1 Tax=Hathewaya histolytica TaxID=1498 RepID=A0A4U9S2B3_HATHI|nr:NAD(P)H-dependent oxidoreductase [Hathewaya histolytica]VTQ95710.1 putative NADPH-quinone reductase [Hathewaya histolytica]
MKHLIIFAHPNPKSFSKGIVESLIDVSKYKNYDVEVRDLYKINFQPVLLPSDFEAFSKGITPNDIKEEQKFIEEADFISFVYPIWWGGEPAILKGYLDRVLSHGFAYENRENGPVPLLNGKKVAIFAPMGNPDEVYENNGMHESMKTVKDEGTFKFCGMKVVKQMFFGAVPEKSEVELRDYLEEVKTNIQELL